MSPAPDLEALILLRQIAQFLHSIIFCFSLGAYDPAAQEGVGQSLNAGILQTVLQPITLLSLLLSSYSHSLFIPTSALYRLSGLGRGWKESSAMRNSSIPLMFSLEDP